MFWFLWVKKCCVLGGSNVELVLVFDNYNLLDEDSLVILPSDMLCMGRRDVEARMMQ